MKLFVDKKPYNCEDCLFGSSETNCTILNKTLNEIDWGCRNPLDDCPLREIEDIKIETDIESHGYSDDMLKVSLILDGEELSSDKFVYREYIGSEDD